MTRRLQASRIARQFFVLVLCVAASAAQAARTTTWRFVDIGTLGGNWSFATALSDHGDVGGYSLAPAPVLPAQESRAFTWSNGTIVDRGLPAGSLGVVVLDMNDKGDMVGSTVNSEAVAMKDGVWSYMGYTGELTSINKFGDMAGRMLVGNTPHAILVRDGVTQDLGLAGWGQSNATAINDHGQIAGYFVDNAGVFHAFSWEKGVVTDLGTGSSFLEATDINNHGSILAVTRDSYFVTQIIDGGVARTLQLGAGNFIGRAMNDRGDVVGIMSAGNQPWTGFLYSDGVVTALDQIPEVARSGYRELQPTAINNRGWIIGVAYNAAREYRAFLLVPR